MKKSLFISTMAVCAFLLTTPAFASSEKTNLQHKEFNVDITTQVQAEQQTKPGYSGSQTGQQITDTRTEEQKVEDDLKAERDRLEQLIKEISDQIAAGGTGQGGTGGTGDNPWDEIPGFGDWVDQNKPGSIGKVELPEWALPENPELHPGELPSFDELWEQFIIENHIVFPPTLPYTPETGLVTGLESADPTFEGMVTQPTDNGVITVTQQTMPIGALVTYAGLNAGLSEENQNLIKNPEEITEIEVTEQDQEPIIIPDITMLPFDFTKWFDEFRDWILEQYPVKPGENADVIEDQFIKNPSIDDMEDMFPGVIKPGQLPGTDIDIGFVDDMQKLYELLFMYMQQLNELNMVNVNVTRFTIYQMTDYDIQTIRTSVPTSEYRWVVSGPGGSVDKVTNSPQAKLLFRAAGDYDVDIFNTQNVYRNNKVTGLKSEVWVLSNGGFFDGLVVYQSTSKFSGFISEDIGPRLEQVRLVDDSFIANVSPSMLNKIQLMDQYGNIRTPADGFATERG